MEEDEEVQSVPSTLSAPGDLYDLEHSIGSHSCICMTCSETSYNCCCGPSSGSTWFADDRIIQITGNKRRAICVADDQQSLSVSRSLDVNDVASAAHTCVSADADRNTTPGQSSHDVLRSPLRSDSQVVPYPQSEIDDSFIETPSLHDRVNTTVQTLACECDDEGQHAYIDHGTVINPFGPPPELDRGHARMVWLARRTMMRRRCQCVAGGRQCERHVAWSQFGGEYCFDCEEEPELCRCHCEQCERRSDFRITNNAVTSGGTRDIVNRLQIPPISASSGSATTRSQSRTSATESDSPA
jgi:hypothetical protein